MTLFRRTSDILTANLHEWIDRWEDPERMLKQLVRELEQACDAAMDATARAIASERLLQRQLVGDRRQAERLQERAREAVIRGDDDAARTALAARLRHQKLVDACEAQQELASHESQRLRRQLDVLRSRLCEAKQTMHVYLARQQLAESRRTLVRLSAGSLGGQAVCGRFDRLCERIDRADAESTALLELLEKTDVDDDSATDIQVNQELKGLKAAVAGAADV